MIPVGHFLMGQVLKAVVVMFAAPWLMVAVGAATGGLGFPVVMLAYAVIMGTDAYLLALRRSAGDPVGPWDTPVVGKLLGAKGLLPARIALPILGMLLVVGSGLCLSLFGVKVALFDDSDLRNQLLIAFSLFHCVFAVIAIVLTARLQHAVAAPAAAVLTMTAWGWYCFATIPPIASILGLLAGMSIGAWALWTFRQPDVKAMFADADKPGPLDRLGMPVFAGSALGLLVLILGIGGVLYAVTRDKSMDKYANVDPISSSSGRQMKERTMKERTMKSRTGGRKSGRPVLEDLIELMGQPDETYTHKTRSEMKLHVWKQGADTFDAAVSDSVFGGGENMIVQTYESIFRQDLDSIIRASYD